MAATTDQAAFVLSIPKRKLMDETQETLRTSAFPSTHVKVTPVLEYNLLTNLIRPVLFKAITLICEVGFTLNSIFKKNNKRKKIADLVIFLFSLNPLLLKNIAGKMVQKPLHCINLLRADCLLVKGESVKLIYTANVSQILRRLFHMIFKSVGKLYVQIKRKSGIWQNLWMY